MAIIPMHARRTATTVHSGSSVACLSVPARGITAITDLVSIDPVCMRGDGMATVQDSTGGLAMDTMATADTLIAVPCRVDRRVAASEVALVASTLSGVGNVMIVGMPARS
jgi:hypothetical protein